jgi:hypothetical protein
MMKRLLTIALTVSTHATTLSPHDPADNLTTVRYEQHSSCQVKGDSLQADATFPTWWAYVALPSARVLGKKVFFAGEVDAMLREYRLGGEVIAGPLLGRIGLFGGATLLDLKRQHGTLMAGAGFAGDNDAPIGNAWYAHLIYDHRITISDRLKVGLGVLVSDHFGRIRKPINLLPYLSWKITPITRLRIAWDVLELRQFVTNRLSASAEARYDLSFFGLNNRRSLEFETVGLGGGVDLWIVRNFYLRARYKEIVFRREILKSGATVLSDARQSGGRSLKIELSYAK